MAKSKATTSLQISVPRWDKMRRKQACYDLYYGTGEFKDQPGMSYNQIAEVLSISSQTAFHDVQYMREHLGEAVRDSSIMERAVQNTLDMVAELENIEALIAQEIATAQDRNIRSGNYLPSLITAATKNAELKAKVLRLLDPKIEISIKTEKAARMQDAILRALSEISPELAEKVLIRAESIYRNGEDAIDITPIIEEAIEGGH